jgi:D-lactate dehydrogenase (cytochrome)
MIIKTDPSTFTGFLQDASNFSGHCDAVYFPENTHELIGLLRTAQADGQPVTVAGNGTGVTGGRVPQGGIVVSMEKFCPAPVYDAEKGTARVAAGVLLGDFMAWCKTRNLFYPPDPTEKNCFVGATIATNASGARTYGYGSTRDFVQALEIVLPDSELLHLRRGVNRASDGLLSFVSDSGKTYSLRLPEITMPPVKNAAGYFIKPEMDAIDLFIGSEGTLGIITEAELRLLPAPEQTLSAVIFFQNETDAFLFTETVKAMKKTAGEPAKNAPAPRSLEFFDGNALRFLAEKFPRIPGAANGAVWIEQDCATRDIDLLLETWVQLIHQQHGMEDAVWFAFNEADAEEIHNFRHAISYLVNEYISQHGLRKLGTDAAVPDDRFAEFLTFCRDVVTQKGLRYVLYGHYGNSHPHLNMLPANADEFAAGKQVYELICRKAVELGGTVSAEHGIGKFKREYLRLLYPLAAIRGMAALKKQLDPACILNRGNIFFAEDFDV